MKKVFFFKWDAEQYQAVTLPGMYYSFKRYYELNGKHASDWEWIPPVFDYDKWTMDEVVADAVNKRADVYMFTGYMWSWEVVKVVASAIHEELPEAIIVLGGPNQGMTYTQPMFWFKDHPYFTATCRPLEYGEYFVVDMLDAISEGNLDWSQVRGSHYRYGHGPVGDKKSFKFPSQMIRSNLDNAKAIAQFAQSKGKMLSYSFETNRGCMYSCTYCEWGGGISTKVIFKDLEDVKDDILCFREIGTVDYIWVTDANFGMFKRDTEIANCFAENKDVIRLVGLTGIAKVKPQKKLEILEIFLKSGQSPGLALSLQSIKEDALTNVKRVDIPAEEYKKIGRYVIDNYNGFVITEMLVGLPGSTLESYYDEIGFEYSVQMNYINPSISRVPVFVFPDAPFSDPAYLEQHKIKLAPISFEDSTIVTSDKNSKYVKMFNDKQYAHKSMLSIPIESYSFSITDWKEMFLMIDMTYVLMNMKMIMPFVDYLHCHRDVPISVIFKKLFLSIANVDEVFKPIYEQYIDLIIEGQYWDKSYKQFEIGPVKGQWTAITSYTWLWCEHKEKIYNSIRTEFAEYVDEIVDDCLTYCMNSTFGTKEEVVWNSKWRWDNWEESLEKETVPVKETVELKTVVREINWPRFNRNDYYRSIDTFRTSTGNRIEFEIFRLFGKAI